MLFRSISTPALQLLTPELIAATVRDSDVLGKQQVLAQLPDIYRKFVANISAPRMSARQAPKVA